MKADIVLLLEGTYPYVRGGVSSWVHQIISSMPERQFYLVFIGGDRKHYSEICYELPDNVIAIDRYFLIDPPSDNVRNKKLKKSDFNLWANIELFFHDPSEAIPADLMEKMFRQFGTRNGLDVNSFSNSKLSWNYLVRRYSQSCDDLSFTDYFWAYLSIYTPLFKIAEIVRKLPPANLYHSISTGYAGFVGAGASLLNDSPLLLSEHGIYTKERKIDLSNASWIADGRYVNSASLDDDIGFFKTLWVSFFEQLAKSAYQQSTVITSLYRGNQQRQLKDGAPPRRTRVIPNGVSLSLFKPALKKRPNTVPKVAALIGRVVSIKDIKNFIRAIHIASSSMPDIQGWVVGPDDEDPEYAQECIELVSMLGLENNLKFLGMQNVLDIFPQIGVVVLTSISEAQPLVLLESMAAGVPFVATDVGSCREIAEGSGEDDKALGASGSIVPIASPRKTSDAIFELLNDSDKWREYQQTGLKRVSDIYDEKDMYQRFNDLYDEIM